ncbi:hypothetical protein M378DRAFT_164803 [Amanita muscaria Koide BX008]|uniref:Uncharacterized protein n=1 Tax=Amanita muscaria (strain Koide BX008) TaxID=946122 RepID=A0A0C2X312_AMAMK|nr:hypothetical protein M378DRAFT_164803 [Amanita muscaria Koide BX008]
MKAELNRTLGRMESRRMEGESLRDWMAASVFIFRLACNAERHLICPLHL